MKVVKVKGRKEREKMERKLLKSRKLVAVVGDVKDIRSEFVKKADVIIIDESFGKDSYIIPN